MVDESRRKSRASGGLRDRYVYLGLILLSVIVRIPFLKAFDLVAYDGTYYINQAKSLFGAGPAGGAFPLGYPLFIALLLPVVGDGVRAAQAVSFLAGVGSVCVLYALAGQFLRRENAVLTAVMFAVCPLSIRLSMMTLSESAYILWILLSLLLFVKEKAPYFGLSMGMAAVTRPEALAVFGALSLVRWRRAKWLAVALAGFAVVYTVNSAVLSKSLGRVVVLPKAGTFASSAADWTEKEAWIEFEGSEEYRGEGGDVTATEVVSDYLRRLPGEVSLLLRHALPTVVLLALYGMRKRPGPLLAPLLPFLIFPVFTFRSEPRFILPYVPVLLLYAFVGLEAVSRRTLRSLFLVILLISGAAGMFFNREMLYQPVSAGFQHTKTAAEYLKDHISPLDKIADRKPFLAFYAGGQYVEIPVATYEETIRHLTSQRVRFLALHRETIHALRPALRPLLYDRAVIRGELRFKQIYYRWTSDLIYERVLDYDPLKWRRVTPPTGGTRVMPAWSPNGERIAYREMRGTGEGGIYLVAPDGGRPQSVVSEQATQDVISWSPDSRRIAFANASKGNMDIVTYDLFTGELDYVTTDAAEDMSPSWSWDGREIAFTSTRSGQKEIWVKHLETGGLSQVTTDGGHVYPSMSPEGGRIAWTRETGGLYIHDRRSGVTIRAEAPVKVLYAPAWHPDGRLLAVTAEDWGSDDVYLVTADGKTALLLTKSSRGNGMPAWRFDGSEMAIVSDQGDDLGIWILRGFGPYIDRVLDPPEVRVLEPLAIE